MVKKKKMTVIQYSYCTCTTYDSYIYIILTFTLNDSIEILEAGFVVSFKDDFYMLLIDLKKHSLGVVVLPLCRLHC